MGILKENLKYLILVILIWFVSFPIVYFYRHKLLSTFTLLFYSDDYSPSRIREYVEDGDKEIKNGNVDLDMMANACEFYRQYQDRENLFYQPKWMESHKIWSADKNRDSKGLGISRGVLPLTINPEEYWKANINTVLQALDYYKRAIHYSGPEILPADKIETVAISSCRPEEIVLGYSDFIYNTEQYVIRKLKKENKLPTGLGERQYNYIAWSTIRSHRYKEVDTNDYLKGLGKLVFTAGIIRNSPVEADQFIERMLFFSQDSEWERNRLYFRRAELNTRLSEKNPGYLDKAILYFETSTEFSHLEDVSPAKIQIYIAHIFEAKINIAKIYLKKNQPEQSLKVLYQMKDKLHQINGSMNHSMNLILNEYKKALRDTYRKMGRLEEADEIDTTP